MDAGLETAVCRVLERADVGADVSERWLQEEFPSQWREIALYVRLQDRLREGRPARPRIGPYRVKRRLGQGAMGTVWLAAVEDADAGPPVGTEVALKVVHPHLLAQPGFREQALREAEFGRSVRHPNVAKTLDVGIARNGDEEDLYLVTEYVEGRNLRGLVREFGAVPEDVCRHVAREVLGALVAIHAAGAVHRDLKPENAIATRDGVVKVMDLGAARRPVDPEALEGAEAFHGSLLYAAPEQLVPAGRAIDGRADLFALGVVLHELASGRRPFGATELTRFVRGGEAPRAPRLSQTSASVSEFFDEFVACLLAHDPDERFPSAREALDVLTGGETSAWWTRRSAGGAATGRAPGTRRAWPATDRIFGRDAELALLRSELDAAAAGGARTVIVEGEAGIGKTRLVEELVAGGGARLVVARHAPGGSSAGVDPILAAMREQFAGADLAPSLAGHLGPSSGLATGLAAMIRGEPAADVSATPSPRAFAEAVAAVWRSLARERAIVLFVDDLHFASPDTLDLFSRLSEALTDARVLVIGSLRAGSLGDWPARVAAAGGVRRVHLERLPESAIREMLAATLSSEESADRVLPIVAGRADGNPYFAIEIVAALRQAAQLVPAADGTWTHLPGPGDVGIPATVRGLIEERLLRIAPGDRDILVAAACCGFEFDALVVASALGLEPLPVLTRLAHVERESRIVRAAATRYTFDHHLVQETLVAATPAAVLAARHEAIAEALLATLASAPRDEACAARFRIADHLLRAGRGDRAAPYVADALSHVDAGFRPSAALAFADRALAAVTPLPPSERRSVLITRAQCLDRMGRLDGQVASLEEAVAIGQHAPDAGGETRALAELANALSRAGRHADAERTARSCLARATASGNPERTEYAHNILGTVLGRIGNIAESAVHFAEALRFAEASGVPVRIAEALGGMGTAYSRQGRAQDALACLERALATIDGKSAPPMLRLTLRLVLASGLLAVGRPRDAIAPLEQVLVSSRERGDIATETIALTELALAVGMTKSLADATALQERALDLAVQARDEWVIALMRHRLSACFFRSGWWQRALDLSDRTAEDMRAAGVLQAEVSAHSQRSFLLGALGDPRAAKRAAMRALVPARESGLRREEATALFALAVADGAAPDLAALLASVRIHREIADRSALVRALLGLSRAYVQSGRTDAARALLREAHEISRELAIGAAAASCAAFRAALGDVAADDAERECRDAALVTPVRDRLEIGLLLHRATGEARHLADAEAALSVLVDGAPLKYRGSMVSRVPLHAAVGQARERLGHVFGEDPSGGSNER